MKKELHKKNKKTENSVYLYVSGGTNETCTNPGCSFGSGDNNTPGGGCVAMGGNTVCNP